MKQEELHLILDNHKKWLNSEAGGVRANLCGADLCGANLWPTIGNQDENVTIQTGIWQIVCTEDVMQIGCHNHSIDDWFKFSDSEIQKMDRRAVKFWKKWKPILMLILERGA